MRRRAHTSIDQSDEEDTSNLFHDVKMEKNMKDSSLIVKKSIYNSRRKYAPSSRISPFDHDCDSTAEVIEDNSGHITSDDIYSSKALTQNHSEKSGSTVEEIATPGESVIRNIQVTNILLPNGDINNVKYNTSPANRRKVTLDSLPSNLIRKKVTPIEDVLEEVEDGISSLNRSPTTKDFSETDSSQSSHQQGNENTTEDTTTVSNELDIARTANTVSRLQTSQVELKRKSPTSLTTNSDNSTASDSELHKEGKDLNEMIAKIRDSPVARPKPNFHAEQLVLKGTYLFHPQEPFILSWQFVMGLGILYSIVIVPFRLGFSADAEGAWYYFEMSIDVFFFVDILFNFRTAYFNEERILIYDVKVITLRYIKGWLFFDLT